MFYTIEANCSYQVYYLNGKGLMKTIANLYNDYSRYYLYQYLLVVFKLIGDITYASSNYEGRKCTFLTESGIMQINFKENFHFGDI